MTDTERIDRLERELAAVAKFARLAATNTLSSAALAELGPTVAEVADRFEAGR